ncbi:MAG: threonine--tRNA ligase [Candidatus Thiodiazotropha sp. (ex Lucina aurantia)]|uniref:Threonine--tRNA ligase n=1 Tax=Candidatus Thiodiazotropha taylori TaxID=2792791 RepID=A0A9E4NHQ4_9GAMM|nr:threonine--tRNA ligase [Candidatus Thiodiazotropha sp. (ex Lucina pensylvanica)]MBT3015495.1 threonine--tRNA ligase [Candidatus Thiodiazotropha taylori]MBT3040274.1 threonine--tRNA ligase [Candidatus Thiodiazotropha sp. (ex Codakia orbicularis)]MBV2103118.1 threonine--tRNA ligase [Candidatus Thiodiazotropha sp. (ex Lucina aurantia)]MCW4235604.1 threonine--tRNA ligase [Candidatus Thiodiazotropha endolucinida]
MPVISLPDGSQREFDQAVTVYEIAADIGPGLAKAALAGRVDGRLVDTSFLVEKDCEVAIVTSRDDEALELIRHDAAHVMAQAVQELYPGTQVTIGPAIEDGFYYDFARDEAFTPDDLKKIEQRMHEIVKRNLPLQREVWDREEAIRTFDSIGEKYKVEIIKEFIPEGEEVSVYRQGDWFDVCRGPHLPSTGMLGKGFKLMKVAGAYWRGDSNNEMLQRIYGTAWRDKKELKTYLHRLEEAEKRDHRKIGKAQDLFHTQEEAPGMAFWHDKGWRIYLVIQQYIRDKLNDHGYQEVHTPQVIDRTLWEKSGHWEKFRDDIFTTETDDRTYAIKPMNCPAHIQIYNHGLKSYRDLPLRLAEFGSCHRNEPSGTLHGLMRVRNFVQDDAHIFCSEEQILGEVQAFNDLLLEVYKDFGFDEVMVILSTRPEKRVGSDEVWDKAEKALEQALNQQGLDWELHPGEGAFYGPKIEFSLRDCLGRVWQLGTIQLDFSMPERLGASYIAEDNSKKVPVMLHRAILGSLERFIGILIEHYAGALPLWLAPVQAVLMNITDRQGEYVKKCLKSLHDNGFRVESDLRNEKIGFKIREHTLMRVPYLLVIGDREMEEGTVAVRTRGGEDLGAMPIEAFIDRMKSEVTQRVS